MKLIRQTSLCMNVWRASNRKNTMYFVFAVLWHSINVCTQ